MTSDHPLLWAMVPGRLLRLLGPTSLESDRAQTVSLEAAVLGVRIMGLAEKVETQAHRGADGAEDVAERLQASLGRAMRLVREHGGEVACLRGSGLLALWWFPKEALERAITAAAACGAAIGACWTGDWSGAGTLRPARVALACGELLVGRYGGHAGKWELLVSGAPLEELSQLLQEADHGRISVSPQALQICPRLNVGIGAAPKLLPVGAGELGGHGQAEWAATLQAHLSGDTRLSSTALTHAQGGELRYASVLGLRLCGLSARQPGATDRLQAAVLAVQRQADRYGGACEGLCAQGRNISCLISFGMDTRVSEPWSLRAARAALSLTEALQDLGLEGPSGLATGVVFRGIVGRPERMRMVLVGAPVARALAYGASRPSDVVCDKPTVVEIRRKADLERLVPVLVPDLGRPQKAYRLVRVESQQLSVEAPSTTVRLVGNRRELRSMRDALSAVEQGACRVLIVEGEAGIGKSRLLTEFGRSCQETSRQVLWGRARLGGRSAPFHAWRAVFASLFAEMRGSTGLAARKSVERSLHRAPELQGLAALMRTVLPIDLPDSAQSAGLDGKARLERTREVLVASLAELSRARPLAVFLDDAQWMDSASWQLLQQVGSAEAPLLLVVATRPEVVENSRELEQLCALQRSEVLKLGSMSVTEVRELVRGALDVRAEPRQLLSWVWEMGGGNPRSTLALLEALQDAGQLVAHGGELITVPTAGELASLSIPGDFEDQVQRARRKLSPSQSTILQVAALLSQRFDAELLAEICPGDVDAGAVASDLEALVAARLLLPSHTEGQQGFSIEPHIALQAASSGLDGEKLAQVHAGIARRIESAERANLSPFYPTLAHHWVRAGDPGRGMLYAEKAGEQAMGMGAAPEAIRFFQQASWLARSGPQKDRATPLRRARWERRLGQLRQQQGELPRSLAHLDRALILLGRPIPKSRLRLWLGLLWQLVIFFYLLILPRSRVLAPADQRATSAEAALAMELLAERFYYSADQLTLAYASLTSANLAERGGDEGLHARPYASISSIMGTLRLSRLSRRYHRRALGEAREAGDVAGQVLTLAVRSAYHLGYARLEKAADMARHAAELGAQRGCWPETGLARTLLGMSRFSQGRYSEAESCYQVLMDEARASGNAQQEGWAWYGQAQCQLRMGRIDGALKTVLKARDILGNVEDQHSQLISYALLAQVRQRRGERRRAQEAANLAWVEVQKLPLPLVVADLEGFATVVEVFLEANTRARAANPFGDFTLTWLVDRSLAALWRYSLLFPLGRARWHLLAGRACALKGELGRAQRHWKRCLDLARDRGQPLEEALALGELAALADDAGQGKEMARQAVDILGVLGECWHRKRIEAQSEAGAQQGQSQ